MSLNRRQVLAAGTAGALVGMMPRPSLAQVIVKRAEIENLMRAQAVINQKHGRFSKGFEHSAEGLLHDRDDLAWRDAVSSGTVQAWNALKVPNDMRFVNPMAAYVWSDLPMAKTVALPPAPPTLDSDALAVEALQLYWMSLGRDEPLASADGSRLWREAAAELSKASKSNVSPKQAFRLGLWGEDKGPTISQLLYQHVPYGAQFTFQKYKIPASGQAFMADRAEWLRIQNGHWPSLPQGVTNLDSEPHYLRTARDLAEYVRSDFSYQPFVTAAAILHGEAHRPREGLAKTHPYKRNPSQNGFVTWGPVHVYSLVAKATDMALKAAWACKWLHHPLLRPEEYGGHVEFQRFVPKWLRETEAVKRTIASQGSALLPQAYPEGAPLHPAYVSGHSAIAGACVTVLKAMFDGERVFRFPQIPTRDGRDTQAASEANLTYAGELNKLAANTAMGRMWAGIHWRCDSLEGLRLGERVGHAVLQEAIAQTPESRRGENISLSYIDLFGKTVTV